MLIIIIIWILALLPSQATADDAPQYTVRIDRTLATLEVEARFDESVTRIAARDGNARRYLLDARDCESGRELSVWRGRLDLRGDGIQCLRYRFDLAAAASDDRRNDHLAPDNVLVSPSLWLWRPRSSQNLDIRFDVDDAVRVSVPWQSTGSGRFRIGPSPRSGHAISAFGAFHYSEPTIDDARLRVAILNPKGELDAGDFEQWLVDTAHNITLTYGRFPNPAPQIVVVPTGSRGTSPVRFGRVLRDGGESVELFVNETRSMHEFRSDWTATHEFSHLMLPYVTIRQRWVSEGFAQYYQNVLLARAGIYDEQQAWQKLYEGLERGRRSRPELSPNDASRTRANGSLMKIYWSGAAMALMADVELRRRSGGSESLDTVLGRLQRCCLPSTRVWTAKELFAKLDEQVEEPLFVPLYQRYANSAGFPDYHETFADLGLMVTRRTVHFDDHAELSGVRQAITKTPVSVAFEDSGTKLRPALR